MTVELADENGDADPARRGAALAGCHHAAL